jgi:hypothetical protein
MDRKRTPHYIEKILNDIKKEDFYENQILHIEQFEKKPPVYGKLNHTLHDKIGTWLRDNENRVVHLTKPRQLIRF